MLWLFAALLITGCSKNSETFAQTMEETMYITIGAEGRNKKTPRRERRSV